MPLRFKSFADVGVYLGLIPRVAVTRHALESYREKVLKWVGYPLTEEEAEDHLREVVQRGQPGRRLPGGAREYVLDGLAVAAREDAGGIIVVLTCQGDREWVKWWWRQEVRRRWSRKALAAL
ncbi:MAG: hypothetical protein ACUVRF_00035 [Desulfotomaculales bacterium]